MATFQITTFWTKLLFLVLFGFHKEITTPDLTRTRINPVIANPTNNIFKIRFKAVFVDQTMDNKNITTTLTIKYVVKYVDIISTPLLVKYKP